MKVGKCKTVAAFKVQIYYMKHYTTRHKSGKAWRQFVVSTLGDFQGIRGNLFLKPSSNFTFLLNPGPALYIYLFDYLLEVSQSWQHWKLSGQIVTLHS